MSDTSSTDATEHLPHFIVAPGETDTLMILMMIAIPLVILGFGVFFLKLHSVPDRMAHKANHNQLQLIGLLTLLALLTHHNVLWLIALVVAALNPPDLLTPLRSMARSLLKLSKRADDPRSENRRDAAEEVSDNA